MASELSVGKKAPAFKMPTPDGDVSLKDYRGKYLVLYFYPRDNTPGCTTEAKDFTAMKDKFDAADAAIVGVSKDSVAKHEKFIAKQELNVTLASDEDSDVCEAYGVWVEKNMYGKKYMGIQRATFLIGPDGKILQIWPKVKVKGHAEAILAEIQTQKDS